MKIPKRFWGLFWDVNPKIVDINKKSEFIIQRILDKGNTDAVKWIRKTYSPDQIAHTFSHTRDFRTKIGNFWSLFLSIPREKVLCLQAPYLKVRKMHWPY